MAGINHVSGNICSFKTELARPLVGMKCHFAPVQDGSGDPSLNNVRPINGWTGFEVAHAGENLIGAFTLDGNGLYPSGGVLVFGSTTKTRFAPAIKGNIYYHKNLVTGYNGSYIGLADTFANRCPVYETLTYTNHGNTTRDNSAGHKYMFYTWNATTTFEEQVEAIDLSVSANGSLINTPPEEGRVISVPWVSQNETKHIDVADMKSGYINSSGNFSSADATYQELYSEYISVTPGDEYTFAYDIETSGVQHWSVIAYYTKTGKFISRIGGSSIQGNTTTAPNNAAYARISMRSFGNISNITFAGTLLKPIMGGYYDVVNGVLVQTYYSVEINHTHNMRNFTEDFRNAGKTCDASYWLGDNLSAPAATGYTAYSTNGYSNKFKYVQNNYLHENHVQASNNTVDIVLEGTRTKAEFLEWLEENGPIQVVYPIATPIEYQLTPQQITAFRNQNNIWCNTNGITEVDYLDRSGPMSTYRRNIIMNSPHDMEGSGWMAKFTTDMRAPLKSMRCYFNPVQGDGVPSPDNVMPISGHTGLSVYSRNENLLNLDIQEGYAYPVASADTTPRTFDMNTYIVGISPQNYYRRNYANYCTNISVSSNGISFTSGGASGYGIGFPIFLIPGYTYTLQTTCTATGNIGMSFYDRGGNRISSQQWSGVYARTATVPGNAWVTLVIFYANTTNSDCSFTNIRLSKGSSGIDYVKSEGDYAEVDWSAAGTLYGGWCDPMTGVGEIEWAKTAAKWNDWDFGADLGTHTRKTLNLSQKGVPGAGYSICNITNTYLQSNSTDSIHYYINSRGDVAYGVFPNDMDADTVVELCFQLDTPQSFTFTPISHLKASRNQNNIWSSGNGTTEVKFWTHGSTVRERKKVVWNQIVPKHNGTFYGVTYTTGDDGWTHVSGSATAVTGHKISDGIPDGHLAACIIATDGIDITPSVNDGFQVMATERQGSYYDGYILGRYDNSFIQSYSGCIWQISYRSGVGIQMSGKIMTQLFDLTLMFGAGNEPSTLAEFEAQCAKNGIDLNTYQPYNTGTERWWYT